MAVKVETSFRVLMCALGIVLNAADVGANCSGGRVLNATQGVITDGPDKYPEKTHCEWLIDAESPLKSIKLEFSEMKTECSFDILFIYDGNSYNSPLIGSYSGDTIPQPVIANSGYMLIHLYSDTNHVLEGFTATYMITDCPYNCSNLGTCINHKCSCRGWYTGRGCETRLCSADSCNGHGTCDAKRRWCICNESYVGDNCNLSVEDNLGSGMWQVLSESSDIFTPRTSHTGVFIPATNSLWIFGGFTLNAILNDVVFYNLSTSRWRKTTESLPWPSARHSHASVGYNDGFFVFGGITSNSSYSSELWHYNTTSGNWMLKAKDSIIQPPKLVGHTLTKVDNWLYLFGGKTVTGIFLSEMYKIDLEFCEQWRKVYVRGGRSFIRRLVGHSTVYHKESKSLLVFGGFSIDSARNSKRTDCLHAFHLEERYWSEIKYKRNSDINVMTFHSAVIMGNYMVLFGGNSHVHNRREICYDHELYFYNLGCHTLTSQLFAENYQKDSVFSKQNRIPNLGRFGHSAAVVRGNILLVAGGYAGRVLGDLIAYKVPASVAQPEGAPEQDHCEKLKKDACNFDPECVFCDKRVDTRSEGCVHYNHHKILCNGTKDGGSSRRCTSICNLLMSCGACLSQGQGATIFNSSLQKVVYNPVCIWCVKEEKCQDKADPQGTCKTADKTPSGYVGWWSGLSAQLTNLQECSTRGNSLAGLHRLKYRNPINYSYPDEVDIIREMTNDIDYEASLVKKVDNEGYYSTHYVGFIYPLRMKPPENKTLQLCLGAKMANTSLMLSRDDNPNHKEIVANIKEYDVLIKVAAQRPDGSQIFGNISRSAKYYVDLTAQTKISQKSQKQNKPRMTLAWNAVLKVHKDKKIEHEFTYEFLEPFHEGTCEKHYNCLSCLTDIYCGWCALSRTCELRLIQLSPHSSQCNGSLSSSLLVTNPENCPVCSDHLNCETCADDNLCEWVLDDAMCVRRGRIKNALTNSSSCHSSCYERLSCKECTRMTNECVWCESTKFCLPFAEYIPLHMYGQCMQWVYSYLDRRQCHNCSAHRNFMDCINESGCGWCGKSSNPTIGRCLDGDFTGSIHDENCTVLLAEVTDLAPGDNIIWSYGTFPDVDECSLHLHTCHPNATCSNTLDSFQCTCNLGFIGDGMTVCNKTCSYNCSHGRCSGAPNYQCECDVGWTGEECSRNCKCNHHSTCSKGIGICDKCLNNTMGPHCEMCSPGSYGDPKSTIGCKPCDCNGHGNTSLNECHNQTGVCYCTDNTEGRGCEKCKKGYYGDPRNGKKCYMYCRGCTVLTNVMKGALGSFEMSGFTNKSQVYCLWIITPYPNISSAVAAADESNLASITFRVEETININCSKDFVYVYDGIPQFINGSTENKATLLGAYCGSRTGIPFEVEAKSGIVTAYYETTFDISIYTEGFNANFEVNWCPNFCSGNRFCNKDGQCICKEGFGGPSCDVKFCVENCVSSERKNRLKIDGSMDMPKVKVEFDSKMMPGVPSSPDLSRVGHALISCGDDSLYLFGGKSLKYGLTNEIWRFNISSSVWEKLIPITDDEPAGRYYHASVCVPFLKTIFIYGGIVMDRKQPVHFRATSDFWKFAVESRKWTKEEVPKSFPAIAGHTLTHVGDTKVILIGGFSTESYFSDKMFEYNASMKTWKEYSIKNLSGEFPLGLYGHSAVYHGPTDTIYVYGGMLYTFYKFALSKELYTYDVKRKEWNHIQPGAYSWPEARLFHTALVTDDYMVVMGGKTSEGYLATSVLLYKLKCSVWQNVTFKDDNTTTSRFLNLFALSSIGTSDWFFIMGGFDGVTTGMVLSVQLPKDSCRLLTDVGQCVRTLGCSSCTVKANGTNTTFCFSVTEDIPEVCLKISSNISEGQVCNQSWFEGRDCKQYTSCFQCLATYPEFKGSKLVCQWCSNCAQGKCIRLGKRCNDENSCNNTQETFKKLSSCANYLYYCDATDCNRCLENENCVWTRHSKRVAERRQLLNKEPEYEWSCILKTVMRSIELNEPLSFCPTRCYNYTDCRDCLAAAGAEGGSRSCSWSKTLQECMPPAYVPLHCSVGECGLVVSGSPKKCPTPCQQHTQCSKCITSPGCGWCAFGGPNGGNGLCLEGGLTGPKYGQCRLGNVTVGKHNKFSEFKNSRHSSGMHPNWEFVKCPPENECLNGHHTCDEQTEKCENTLESFTCKCKHGYQANNRTKTCEPVCTQGCIHGKCKLPNACKCEFGWVGSNCSVQCQCNGHSDCKNEVETKNCLECHNNTQGAQCEECRRLFVGDPRNGGKCTPCREFCKGHTEICITKDEFNNVSLKDAIIHNEKYRLLKRGPLSKEAICVNCQDNTVGKYCESCQRGHFRLKKTPGEKCQQCKCNGHADYCDVESGANCPCKNNTESKCDKDQSNADNTCWKMQCSFCKEYFLGTPTDGHQCYRQMTVDKDYCFDPTTQTDCNKPKPLLLDRTVFYAVQPKYLNVNIRITVDVTKGVVDIYFSHEENTFVVDVNKNTGVHQVSLDSKFTKVGNVNSDKTLLRNHQGVEYIQNQIKASDRNKFITVNKPNTILIVLDVRFRLVITLPLDIHNLKESRFYMILHGRNIKGNGTFGNLFFRQDQPHIDLFVFFSVFFSCFFLFLAKCVVLWKIKQTFDAQRSRQQRAREMQHMASRPFAGVLVLIDHDPSLPILALHKIRVNKSARSPQLTESNLTHPYLQREEQFNIAPIAVEPTDDGVAAVATVAFQLPGGGCTPSKMCLGSALTMRLHQSLGGQRMTMRRRPSSSIA